MSLFRSLVARRLLLSVALVLIGIAILTAFGLNDLKSALRRERMVKLTENTEIALGTIAAVHAQVEKGALSETDGKLRARDALRAIRYGNGDYFYVFDENGVNQVHGASPGGRSSR